MPRRCYAARMLLPLLLACTSPEGPAPAAPRAEARPDIVLVVVDTLRADHLSLYGHERPTSPNIDRLGAQGAWYSRAYAHSGWTLASFASLLTGLFPSEHRVVRDSRDPTRFGRLPPEIVTLGEALSEAGYATGAVVNNTFLAPEFGLQQGFDTWDWKGADTASHRGATDTNAAGLAWLERQKGPSLLLLHYMEPHFSYSPPDDVRGTFAPREDPPIPTPIPDGAIMAWRTGAPPSPEVQDYVKRLYDEEILAADRAIGQLVAALERRDRWERTVLVITADHGEEFWDHGGFEHGHSVYGELTRVPLVVVGAPARGEVREVVSHADLFQGLLGLAGATRPPGSRGVDLFATGAAREGLALSENCLYGPEQTSVVDGRSRMTVDLAAGSAEVWRVGERGDERTRLQGQEQAQEGERLLPELKRLRGGLDPIEAGDGTRIQSAETFQQLKSLGYLEDPEVTPSPAR